VQNININAYYDFFYKDFFRKDMDMGRLILVTGGARSGKSTFAEETVAKFGENILYIATSIPFDDEMKLRIKLHREQRPASWETIEAYRDIDTKISQKVRGKSGVMLDCITIMVSNLMLEKAMDWEGITVNEIALIEVEIKAEINKLIAFIEACEIPFVIVTNELGMGVVPPTVLGRVVRDVAGRANQALAKAADEVHLCVSGIPVKIK